jgi:hypothetical protein
MKRCSSVTRSATTAGSVPGAAARAARDERLLDARVVVARRIARFGLVGQIAERGVESNLELLLLAERRIHRPGRGDRLRHLASARRHRLAQRGVVLARVVPGFRLGFERVDRRFELRDEFGAGRRILSRDLLGAIEHAVAHALEVGGRRLMLRVLLLEIVDGRAQPRGGIGRDRRTLRPAARRLGAARGLDARDFGFEIVGGRAGRC